MKKFLIIICALLVVGTYTEAYAVKSSNDIITPQTQLQKRQYQTREFNHINKNAVMKAMLNVLQDDGFIVQNANSLLGFISGAKEFSTKDKKINFEEEFGASKKRGAVVAVVETTANVTEFGKEIKVRINFKRKLLNVYGNAIMIEEVTDENYYKNFFSKVDKAIFIQKQKI